MLPADTIGITLGDPSGIGPSIVAQAVLAAPPSLQRRLLVFCDRPILERAFHQLGHRIPENCALCDRGALSPEQAPVGKPTEPGARAQVAYLEAAIHAARSGGISALVTAPISKTQSRSVGFAFPGHTEFLADRLGCDSVAMMFVGPRLRIVLATVHLALREVPDALTQRSIARVVKLAATSMRSDFGIEAPTVGVLALNPHAGENGLFGSEETTVIGPAIAQCRRELSIDVAGPLVPDAALLQPFDVFVAMYHDQALIPAKLLDFDQTVNVTLGLPIVRTSPDHGVAYDIAGTPAVRADSFKAALSLADRMMAARRNAL